MEYGKGWMCSNLKCYGNTIVPDQLVKDYGMKTVKNLLIIATGRKIKMEKGKSGAYIAWFSGEK